SEAKIRNNEELLRGIAESVLDNIIVINREGIILYVNQSFGRLLGIGAEQMIGLHMSDVSKMKMVFSDCERIKTVFISGIPVHELHSIKHNSVEMLMDSTFIPEKDQSGLVSSVLIVLRNISSLQEEIAQMGFSHILSR
ncbi:MAG: hypothetical protein CVV33_08685, partial [Methanomicrobiales archaeon HGW-Methanomicrobiales-4]